MHDIVTKIWIDKINGLSCFRLDFVHGGVLL